MTKNEAKKIFDRYNNKDLVVRCPNGKSNLRDLLDLFALSATNLYGVISVAEFVDLFNYYNSDFKTNSDEVQKLLMPIILKKEEYCFYMDYLVTEFLINDYYFVEECITLQGNKPRYIPSKSEFIAYADNTFRILKNTPYWDYVLEFILDKWPNDAKAIEFYIETATLHSYSVGDINPIKIIDSSDLEFDSLESVTELINLLVEAGNNTRLFENKGYTPTELHEMYQKTQTENSQINFDYSLSKIGVNEPCYCGSGKKYKKCCLLIENSTSSYLSYDETKLFYETWYGLLGYVNETHKVISQTIKAEYPNDLNDEEIFEVREALWSNPSLIKDYYKTSNLPKNKINMLKSWEKHYKSGDYMVLGYTKDYAVIKNIKRSDDLVEEIGLVGISRSISDVMRSKLPIFIKIVLLPFNDRIIYDGYIQRIPIDMGDDFKNLFDEEFKNLKKENIMTSFN